MSFPGGARGGKIDLKAFDLVGQAFTASSQGSIPIANVLTNSPIPKIPINVASSAPLPRRRGSCRRMPQPTLPTFRCQRFARLKGTLGDPKPDIDELATAAMLAKSFGVLDKIKDERANKLIDGLLGPRTGAGTNAPTTSTNVPAAAAGVPGLATSSAAAASRRRPRRTSRACDNTVPLTRTGRLFPVCATC